MEDFFDLPTLIVIGLAIVILFRLRSVLGTRTGNERTPLERAKTEAAKAEDTVVPMRPRPVETVADADQDRKARRLATEIEQFSRGSDQVSAGLKVIADADPTFGPKSFIE